MNNNAGIFDYMIGEAEDQECKEAFPCVLFPAHGNGGPDAGRAGGRIERWLREHFRSGITFEVADALAKLVRLDLLDRAGGPLTVPAPQDALARLRRTWTGLFPTELPETAVAERA